ncbi:MAG: hypothetical protein WA020_13095, partial [Candidatus Acidiferrales bacterium]
ITTANFDFLQHYRPLQNVVKRPTAAVAGKDAASEKSETSRGYALTGHHEILMPLLAAALVEADEPAPSTENPRASLPSRRQRPKRAR